MKHAAVIPTEKTLCGQPSFDKVAGYIFTEEGMKLRSGQQYSLFKDSVDCEGCLEAGKALVEDRCDTCGNIISNG
jgi:hypothetical protein